MNAARKLHTVAHGRLLAIRMLREFQGASGDACSCESQYRQGEPQRDILGRYLQTLRELDPAVTAGWCFIMNDYLSADGTVDIELYERLEREGYDNVDAA